MTEQHKRLHHAGDLDSRHVGRMVRVGDVEGHLTGIVPCADRVDLVLIVGGARAIFPLTRDADVEVWRP